MIRISRIIAKERIADLLDLNFVSKIELRQGKQGFNNPAICRVEIYLLLENDKEYFNSKMADIKGVYVAMHQNVKYPGVVYFRTVADAQKAVKILGKKLLPLLK